VSEKIFSCVISFLVAVSSAVVVWIGLDRLSWETRQTTLELADLKLGRNHFAFKQIGKKTRCFGSLSATLTDNGEHLSVEFTGWLNLLFQGRPWVQDFKGMLSFNPLAQMGGSLLEIPAGDDVVKIGTKNLNPISLLIFKSGKDLKPVFEQELPGPIELRRNGETFRLTSPLVIDDSLKSSVAPFFSSIPLKITRDDTLSCTKFQSQPLDLTLLVNLASSLRSRLINLIPGELR
jgi:hypothetical protein